MEKIINGKTFIFKEDLTVGDVLKMRQVEKVERESGEAGALLALLNILLVSIDGETSWFEEIITGMTNGIHVINELGEIVASLAQELVEKKSQ